VNHLKSVHQDIHEEYEVNQQRQQEKEKANKSSTVTSKQLSLEEVQEKVYIWDINDARAQRLHRLVSEMIALDNQPFSVVEDPGFIRLVRVLEPRYVIPSRKYLVDKVLPTVHSDVTSWVKNEIETVSYFSFTTDAWSAAAGNASLLSLTAHWLTDNFLKKSTVLHVQPFGGFSHW